MVVDVDNPGIQACKLSTDIATYGCLATCNTCTYTALREVCWSVMESLTLNHDSSTLTDSPHQTNSWYVDVSLAGILSSM